MNENDKNKTNPEILIKKIGSDLFKIEKRLREESVEKKKQARVLDEVADNIGQTNNLFWSNPDVKIEKPFTNLPLTLISTAGATVSNFAEYLDRKPVGEIEKKEIEQFIGPTGDLFQTITSTNTAILGFNINLPIRKIDGEETAIKYVSENLQTDSLRKEFAEAWDSFHHNVQDPNRAASFLMREAVTHFFEHEAPRAFVIDSGIPLEKPNEVHRSDKTKFILLKHQQNPKAEVLKSALKNLEELYHSLSIAHKPKSLTDDRLRIKGYLMQATQALELYLRNK